MELKFRDKTKEAAVQDACCCERLEENVAAWVTGTVMSPAGPVRRISTALSRQDYWEHFKCRTTAYRNNYKVAAGLYAVGSPDANSDVFASANYKYSFDILRHELEGLDAWVLVLDTQGINVWCAAGKGTFGTSELAKRILVSQLAKIVVHRRIIVPQLGAPGVSAFKIRKATGFGVQYGPVNAKDIQAYIRAGCKATREMRKVVFSLSDRLVLTPMEMNPAMKRFPLFAAIVLTVFGLSPSGILFRDAFWGGLPFLILGLVSVLAGAFVTPVMLPYIPFRSFAVKGWVTGFLCIMLSTKLVPFLDQQDILLRIITFVFFPLASSYIALQFTGSTTFTGMSGVKKELRFAVPAYLASCAVSAVLLAIFKFVRWGVI